MFSGQYHGELQLCRRFFVRAYIVAFLSVILSFLLLRLEKHKDPINAEYKLGYRQRASSLSTLYAY